MKQGEIFNQREYELAERYSEGFADGFAAGIESAEKGKQGCEYCCGDETGTTLSIVEIHGRNELVVFPKADAYGTPELLSCKNAFRRKNDVYPIYYCPMCGRKLL